MKIIFKTFIALLLSLAFASQIYAEDSGDAQIPQNISRLFIAPMGRMLQSGIINVAFGGAFASQGGKEYLGLISLGLGGIAEFEISTSHLVTNIFSFAEPVGTTALKFKLYSGSAGSKISNVIIALRSNQWSTVEGSGGDLLDEASPERNPGISSIDFEVHLTSLYIASSMKLLPHLMFHNGIVVDEVITRNIDYEFQYGSQVEAPADLKKSVVSIFVGLEHEVNSSTSSIIEIGAKPKIKFQDELRSVTLTQLWYGMAGVRFFFNNLSSLDAGIRYRADYSGLADAEIRAGLNLGLDLQKKLKGISRRKAVN